MADFNRLPLGVIHRCDRTNRTSECIPCNSLPNGIHPSAGQRGFDLLYLMLQDGLAPRVGQDQQHSENEKDHLHPALLSPLLPDRTSPMACDLSVSQ